MMINFNKHSPTQSHSPDGKKRGGADAVSLGGPLVMQVVKVKQSPYVLDHPSPIALFLSLKPKGFFCGGTLKRKIISGEQLIQGEFPSFFRAHLDILQNLMLEIRAGLVPPCFAVLGGGDHVLTLKHLAQNMVAGEKSVFCFDISASKGNPWNRLLPTVTDLEIPQGCQVYILFGISDLDGDGLDDFYQKCLENEVTLVLMAENQRAIDQTDFTLPKNTPVFSFDEKRNLIKLSDDDEQAVSPSDATITKGNYVSFFSV